MSKKKSFSGSTMTLRDFHGGSIPSELPLPSAPGMVAERKNERPGSGGWGSSLHRGYGADRASFSRQSSGNFARSFDERVSYLPNPANIGRNYDEDERKPVEGHGHRVQSSDSYDDHIYEQRPGTLDRYSLDNRGSYTPKFVDSRAERFTNEEFGLPSAAPPKLQIEDNQKRVQTPSSYSGLQDRLQDSPGFYQSQSCANQTAQHLQEPTPVWRHSSAVQQPVTPGSVMGSGTGVQNVWTARKEGEPSGDECSLLPSSRISQVSALEKVSSGRWNSRIINQSSVDQLPQIQALDYNQSHAGHHGSLNVNSSFSNDIRYLADNNLAPYNDSSRTYNDNTRTEVSRPMYMDSGRVTETVPSRDSRYDMEMVPDTRFMDSRGMSLPDSARHIDDRHTYDDIGLKAQREGSRHLGTEGSGYVDAGYTRGPREVTRYSGNEAIQYADTKARQQINSGLPRPEPSPRREYAEGQGIDTNRTVSSDFPRRSFANHDVSVDNDSGVNSYSLQSYEGPRSTHPENSYHGYGKAYEKEESGQVSSLYLKGRDHFSHEVSDAAKTGRLNERIRTSDYDQSQAGRLRSPGGGIHSSVAHGNTGVVTPVPAELESKNSFDERPKLKLLPRSKPLEVDSMTELGQEKLHEGFEPGPILGVSPTELTAGSLSSSSAPSIGVGAILNVNDEASWGVERPKLSLKPRSQPVDVLPKTGSVKERISVFGGARPRELVLKDRGIDESVIVASDIVPSPVQPVSMVRAEYSLEKHDKVEDRRLDGVCPDQHDIGNAKQFGRNESGRLQRNESRGRKERGEVSNSRHPQERREADRPDVSKQESWRRSTGIPSSPIPIAQSEISSGSGSGPGRIAIPSAVELAQAFSRSASFGSTPGNLNQRSSMPRSPAVGLNSPDRFRSSPRDVPFSRLTESLSPAPRDVYASGVQGGYRRTSAF